MLNLISDDHADERLGEYTTEKLQQYTGSDNTIEIFYYFGSYHESVQLPLIQVVWIYEEQKLIYFGYVLWDTTLDWDEWYIEDDAKYLSQSIANSLTEYLVEQKIIRDKRHSRVEF